MMESHPVCYQSGTTFTISTDDTLRENVRYLSENFPVSVYTQQYRFAAQDSVPFHWHTEIQLCWAFEGVLDYMVNGKAIRLYGDDILLIGRHQLHSVHPAGGDAKTVCINFDPAVFPSFVVSRFLTPMTENSTFSYQILPFSAQEQFTLRSLRDWTGDPAQYFSLLRFLAGILEKCFEGNVSAGEPGGNEDLILVQNALNEIHIHFAEPLRLEDLTTAAHVGRNKLTQLFDRYVGMPPMRYLNDYRLIEAKSLIQNTSLPISRISEEVGFNQLSNFIQLFRRKYGTSPLQYRKNTE